MMRLMFILFAIILTLSGGACETAASGRIHGGHFAGIESFPYIVSLQGKSNSNSNHFCGGVILTRRFIITAAHCVDEISEGDFSIKAGTENLRKAGSSREIERIILHPKWNRASMDFDFALLKLDKPLIFSDRIRNVKLPQYSTKIAIKFGTAAGWGVTHNRTDDLNFLRAVDLVIIEKCILKQGLTITESMFCAGHSSGRRDTCRGDSGGPFVRNHVLYGIISFGSQYCFIADTGVYAKVPYVVNWILENIRKL